MSTRVPLRLALLVSVMLPYGCGIMEGDCPDIAPPDPVMEVFVSDARTGENLAEGAWGTVEDGDFFAILEEYPRSDRHPVRSLGFNAARDGEYDLTIRHDGYGTWTGTAVVAVEGNCYMEASQTVVDAELVAES